MALGLGLGLGLARGSAAGIWSQPAEALPSGTSAGANYISGKRLDVAGVVLPSGDWSIGGWFKMPAGAGNESGYVFSLYPVSGSYGLSLLYDRDTGVFKLGGVDDAANVLGSHGSFGVASSVLSAFFFPQDVPVFVTVQMVGNYAQIWVKIDGQSPVKVSEEYTVFGAVAAQNFRFARGRADSAPLDIYMRGWFKLAYSLTADQIEQTALGTDPSTFDTYAADDFYIPFGDSSGANWSSTINSITTITNHLTTAPVTGYGYSELTDAVYLNLIGDGDGYVIQHTGGVATVAISGTYRGDHSQDIEVQIIDDNNKVYNGWSTVDTTATGNVWSGSLEIPKGKRWLRLQMRKVGYSDVMTSSQRWGVGNIILLSGQSLMDYVAYSGGIYGSSGNFTNEGYYSLQRNETVVQTGVNTNVITITGAASSGGLIEITTLDGHGRQTGEKVFIKNIVGTVEANELLWTVTVTGKKTFTLDGSTFANAYTSGGTVRVGKYTTYLPNGDYFTFSDGRNILGNYMASQMNTVVALINNAVSGTSIATHYNFNDVDTAMILSANQYLKISSIAWCQGHNDNGLSPIRTYFADGGTEGAWTGWGRLGLLFDHYKAFMPNSDFNFGVVPYHSLSGRVGYSTSINHEFRHGMKDWCDRKIANSETQVFVMGFQHDFQPQLESNNIGAHLKPVLKGTWGMAARIAQDVTVKVNGAGNNTLGAEIISGSRSGAIIDLTLTHNGGTALSVITSGSLPSGFEVASDSGFSTILAVSNITITDANTVQITLASDPAATVYIRYMHGYVGNYTSPDWFTPMVTGVADNGGGLIRITTATSDAQQPTGGHNLTTGDWIRLDKLSGVSATTDGEWEVTVIDTQNFDLIGSDSTGLGTYASSNYDTVETDIAIPIYDNRVIGGVALGAPVQPTYTAVAVT